MKKLYIISTVGGFDMETNNIKNARKILSKHASEHVNIEMGIYELVQTSKLSRYANGRIKWHSKIKC